MAVFQCGEGSGELKTAAPTPSDAVDVEARAIPAEATFVADRPCSAERFELTIDAAISSHKREQPLDRRVLVV